MKQQENLEIEVLPYNDRGIEVGSENVIFEEVLSPATYELSDDDKTDGIGIDK